MKTNLTLFFLSHVTFSNAAVTSQHLSEISLCGKNETVYFSCVLENEKIVSLCGDGDHTSSPYTGYVQYRFGLPSKQEMIYPKTHKPPVDVFFKSDNSGGSVTTANEVFFSVGDYKYILGYAMVNNGYLAVVKGNDEQQIFLKRCDKRFPIVEIPQKLSRFENR